MPEFKLLQIIHKILSAYSVKFKKPYLGITPKPFYPINLDLPVRKLNTPVYSLMLKSAYYQAIISLELIRVYNAPS